MQQRGGDLAAHPLSERKLPRRRAEQLAQIQQLGQTREGFSIGGAVDAVDVAQQLEAVGDGHVPPKLRALSEHHTDLLHMRRPLLPRHAPVDDAGSAVGVRTPLIILMVLLFPAPFGPM